MIPGGLWIRNHQDSSDDEVLEDTASRLRTSFTPLRGNMVEKNPPSVGRARKQKPSERAQGSGNRLSATV
jgi:hypothetical protein